MPNPTQPGTNNLGVFVRPHATVVVVGDGAEVTLTGLFVDYVDHLRRMLGRWESGAT